MMSRREFIALLGGAVAARPREARDETAAYWIGAGRENDGDAARLLQHRRGGGCVLRKNEIGLQRDDFRRESLHQLQVGRRPASFDPDIAALRPTELLESLAERRDKGLAFRVALGICHQHVDPPHPLGLLRARYNRPRNRRAAKNGDKLPPPQMIDPHLPPPVRGRQRILPKMACRGQEVCGLFRGAPGDPQNWESIGSAWTDGLG